MRAMKVFGATIILAVIIVGLVGFITAQTNIFVPPDERARIQRVIEEMDFEPTGDWTFTGSVTGAGGGGGGSYDLPLKDTGGTVSIGEISGYGTKYEVPRMNVVANAMEWEQAVFTNQFDAPLQYIALADVVNIGGLGSFGAVGQVMKVKAGGTELEWANDDNSTYTFSDDYLDLTVADVTFAQPANIVTVGKSGGVDYNTIQGAIDAITDNATDKRYTVLVYPGTYTENIAMEDFVSLHGIGNRTNAIIDGTVTFASDAGDESGLFNLGIKETVSADLSGLIVSPSQDHYIHNCVVVLNSTTNGVQATMFDIDAGTFKIINCDITYNFTGSTDSNQEWQRFADVENSTIMDIYNNLIDIDIGDEDDYVVVFDEANTAASEIHFSGNEIHLDLNHAGYDGTASVCYLHGTGSEHSIGFNHFHMTSNGGAGDTGYIYYSNDLANGTINSTSNRAIVSGFDTGRFYSIAVGDVINSHGDEVQTSDASICNGSCNYASSFSDGNFNVSGILTAAQYSGIMGSGGLPAYGAVGQVMKVKAGGSQLEWANDDNDNTVYMATSPLNLVGTSFNVGGLSSYGAVGQVMKVAAGGSSLEWGAVSGGHVAVTDSLRGTSLADSCTIYVQPGQSIANAIAAIDDEATDKRYTVVLRNGRHTISSELVMAQYISLRGEDRSSTWIYTSSALDPMIRLANNTTISNMTIYHDGANGDDQAIFDTNGAGVTSAWIINCDLRHDNTSWDGQIVSCQTGSMTDFRILNCELRGDDEVNPEGEAVYIGVTGDPQNPWIIKDCHFQGWEIGIRRYNPTIQYGSIVDNCTFHRCVNQAYYTRTSYSTTFYDYMSNCEFQENGSDIHIYNESGGTFNMECNGLGNFVYTESASTNNVVFRNYFDKNSWTDENGVINTTGPVVYVPNAASNAGTSVSDDGAITVTAKLMRVVGADADALLDTAPAINDGAYDGQMVIIQGTADGNTVTIADNCNTALAGDASCILGDGHVICLIWDSNDSNWIEQYRNTTN